MPTLKKFLLKFINYKFSIGNDYIVIVATNSHYQMQK